MVKNPLHLPVFIVAQGTFDANPPHSPQSTFWVLSAGSLGRLSCARLDLSFMSGRRYQGLGVFFKGECIFLVVCNGNQRKNRCMPCFGGYLRKRHTPTKNIWRSFHCDFCHCTSQAQSCVVPCTCIAETRSMDRCDLLNVQAGVGVGVRSGWGWGVCGPFGTFSKAS